MGVGLCVYGIIGLAVEGLAPTAADHLAERPYWTDERHVSKDKISRRLQHDQPHRCQTRRATHRILNITM